MRLPNHEIHVMDLSISPLNRKIRAASRGNGVYERSLFENVVGIDGNPPLAHTFSLQQNYPNPFNPETTIPFALKESGEVSLKVFNTLYQEIRTLLNGEKRTAGVYREVWDGRNQAGAKVASGVYLYRLQVGSQVASKRMILTK